MNCERNWSVGLSNIFCRTKNIVKNSIWIFVVLFSYFISFIQQDKWGPLSKCWFSHCFHWCLPYLAIQTWAFFQYDWAHQYSKWVSSLFENAFVRQLPICSSKELSNCKFLKCLSGCLLHCWMKKHLNRLRHSFITFHTIIICHNFH